MTGQYSGVVSMRDSWSTISRPHESYVSVDRVPQRAHCRNPETVNCVFCVPEVLGSDWPYTVRRNV